MTTMMTVRRLVLAGKKNKKVTTLAPPPPPPRSSKISISISRQQQHLPQQRGLHHHLLRPSSASSEASSPVLSLSNLHGSSSSSSFLSFQSRSFSYNPNSNNNNNNRRRYNDYSNYGDVRTNNRRFSPPNYNSSHHYNNSSSSSSSNNSNSKIFVSRYNNSLNVSANDIIEYCQAHIPTNGTGGSGGGSGGGGTRQTSTHVLVRECPFCHKPTNNKVDNFYKLYVQIGSGAYFCHRCGTGGSWYDFKSQLNTSSGGSGGGNSHTHNVSSIGMNMNMNYGAGGGRMTAGGAAVPAAGPGGGSSWGGSGTRMGVGNYGGDRNGRNGFSSPYASSSSSSSSSSSREEMRHHYQQQQQQQQQQPQIMMGHQNHHHHQQQEHNSNSIIPDDGTTPCLPLPAARLSGYYSTRLLDDNNNNNSTTSSDQGNNSKSETIASSSSSDVLKYLETVRGLNKTTLRKYGVGRATYKFPSEQGGYQDAECVTFPWIMRESDVQLQESLRGAKFVLNNNKNKSMDSKYEDKSDNDGTKTATTTITVATSASGSGTSNEKDENQKPADDSETKTSLSPPPTQITPPVQDHDDITAAPTGAFVTRRIKVRALQQKSWQRLDPPGGGWGLFGLHTVPDDATEIVLTEGEYDAMAVSQATGRPAVSLPNGCRSLPVQVLPLLERFEKIYLWMDNDQPGQEGAEKFAKKLGLNRCFIVHCTEAKDANDALLKGTVDLNEELQQAQLVPHERILTFQDLRHDVLHELLEPDKYSGVPVPSLPTFTRLIKGFRRGELTVITGPTGSGKTTFLGQVSLDLAEQGINVLWGSFEIKNTRLLHKLLRQFSRNALPDSKAANASELLQSIADRFQSLPLYFMKFHGGSDVDEVLDAMEYAVYVNDVEHIVLDNMQFMITRNNQRNSFDKFDVQDIAIEKFRKFATEHNVHITLVVHPRKEDEASKLGMNSFFGSAKATQEADTVLILQNDGRRKYIDVKKNRFDGTLGYSPLYFQSSSGRYVENEMEGDRQQSQTMAPMQHQPTETKPPAPRTRPDLENHWQFSTSVPPNRA